MKTNAALRLAKTALACACFGTMFSSCTKEDEVSPLSQTAVLTSDDRNERTHALDMDARKVHLQSMNNEQTKTAGAVSGEFHTGNGKLIGKRPDDRCLVVQETEPGEITATTSAIRHERGRSFEMDARQDHRQSFNNEQSRIEEGTAGDVAGEIGKLIGKRPAETCGSGKCADHQEPIGAVHGYSVRRFNMESNRVSE